MTHKVGAKGQVVVPKELRDSFGIEPGDEVVFWRCGDHVAIKAKPPSEDLMGRFRGVGLLAELEAERRAERSSARW